MRRLEGRAGMDSGAVAPPSVAAVAAGLRKWTAGGSELRQATIWEVLRTRSVLEGH